MKIILSVIFFMISNLALCQELSEKEKYEVFSSFLKYYKKENHKGRLRHLVVKEITHYNRNSSDGNYIKWIAKSLQSDKMKYWDLMPRIINRDEISFNEFVKDTSWISLLINLDEKIQLDYFIKDEFNTSIKIEVISYNNFLSFFNDDIDEGWNKFYKKYPKAKAVVEFSNIVHNNEYVIFYFAENRNGFYGSGKLVFFHKKNKKWKLFALLNLWVS